MKVILGTLLIFLNLMACGPDNRPGKKWKFIKSIENSSGHEVSLNVYSGEKEMTFDITSGDLIIFEGSCSVTGGNSSCGIGYYSFIDRRDSDDSVHIVYDNERIQRFNRNDIICCVKNILIPEAQWGYIVDGKGTSLESFRYVITEQDYNNAEPISGQ